MFFGIPTYVILILITVVAEAINIWVTSIELKTKKNSFS